MLRICVSGVEGRGGSGSRYVGSGSREWSVMGSREWSVMQYLV